MDEEKYNIINSSRTSSRSSASFPFSRKRAHNNNIILENHNSVHNIIILLVNLLSFVNLLIIIVRSDRIYEFGDEIHDECRDRD